MWKQYFVYAETGGRKHMKLKTKILLLVLLPILIIGAATYIVGSIRITSVVPYPRPHS